MQAPQTLVQFMSDPEVLPVLYRNNDSTCGKDIEAEEQRSLHHIEQEAEALATLLLDFCRFAPASNTVYDLVSDRHKVGRVRCQQSLLSPRWLRNCWFNLVTCSRMSLHAAISLST